MVKMDTMKSCDLADQVVATLQAHETELRAAGVSALAVFGSVARGDAGAGSDVDLVAELAAEARIGLFRLIALQRRLSELLDRPVDLLPEPVELPRLKAGIERDRRCVF